MQTEMRIIRHDEVIPTTIKFPLCYRHDLCFWLKEGNTENELLVAIRKLCGNLIHSFRLLKVLRYEDSDRISYCYRIIYNRIDGPFTHLDSVNLQNYLRKHLIGIGFELR